MEKDENKEIYKEFETFFPPPWSPCENKEKTEGWIEFQRRLKRGDYKYWGLTWPIGD